MDERIEGEQAIRARLREIDGRIEEIDSQLNEGGQRMSRETYTEILNLLSEVDELIRRP